MKSNHIRHHNSQERIQNSHHRELLSRIDTASSLARLRLFVSCTKVRGKNPDYITSTAVGFVLGLRRKEVVRALTESDLLAHAVASDGIRLFSIDALQAFILDLYKASVA